MTNDRYRHVDSRKDEGAFYTPLEIADFISDNIISNLDKRDELVICDPAVGDGALLISLIKKLNNESISIKKVVAFDINKDSLLLSKMYLEQQFPDLSYEYRNEDFLSIALLNNDDDLFSCVKKEYYDVIISNPPYIRTQRLGADISKVLSKNFEITGRVDIYHAFLISMKYVLSEKGIAGVIVSNRFLTTKGSNSLRLNLYSNFKIHGIFDFGDTNLFDAAVLPSVLILQNVNQPINSNIPFMSMYKKQLSKEPKNIENSKSYTNAILKEGYNSVNGTFVQVKHGKLAFNNSPADVWRLQTEDSKNWLIEVERNTFLEFKDVGKIRVGVKTTADKVFIREDWGKGSIGIPELLRELTTHHIAKQYKAGIDPKKKILYPHETVNGKRKVIDISKYPETKKYLELHKTRLESRKYIIDAGKKWYEIWVPQNPAFWNQPKVIFRDISEKPTFWMDDRNTIVNGDCYWLINENTNYDDDILWLILAVANSRFIEDFYDVKFQNKLYANRRRFISQYVEQFPIPDPNRCESIKLVELAKKRFYSNQEKKNIELEEEINSLVWQLFNVWKI